MALTTLVINHDRASDLDLPSTLDIHSAISRLGNFIDGCEVGALIATNIVAYVAGVKATGTITFATSSGTVGATIGGTLVTVVWATSDTLSAAALAVAINANTTVNKWVSAASNLGVTTLTALVPGYIGNNVTLVLSGTNVTVSGAKLTGGTNTAGATFSF